MHVGSSSPSSKSSLSLQALSFESPLPLGFRLLFIGVGGVQTEVRTPSSHLFTSPSPFFYFMERGQTRGGGGKLHQVCRHPKGLLLFVFGSQQRGRGGEASAPPTAQPVEATSGCCAPRRLALWSTRPGGVTSASATPRGDSPGFLQTRRESLRVLAAAPKEGKGRGGGPPWSPHLKNYKNPRVVLFQ